MSAAARDLKQLFQQEFGRMVAVISRSFGLEHIELAEDIVSETFLTAAETWGMKGMPPNPTAWLYAVAKQKTLYHFRRGKIFSEKVAPELRIRQEKDVEPNPDFSPQTIRDSQLQMLFAVCTPVIASEAQIGLALRILCGFGIDEIAEAWLTNKETINKRLFRAREKLRSERVSMAMPPEGELPARLDNVLHIIYLLFSEGYYSTTQNELLRKDLCVEALRLGLLLTEYEKTNQPRTSALVALMCFHASRFGARRRVDDSPVLYEDQDESLWDAGLIRQGWHFLDLSARGDTLSAYQLEARIAAWHTVKEDSPEKWQEILQLYDRLCLLHYSPSVALHRVFALYKVKGAVAAIAEAETLALENNHFYSLLLGELYRSVDAEKARAHLGKALDLARTAPEKEIIRQKLGSL
jgi:RNA polymerase sigma-70 factor (ECF subfamily)